ncbi:hypothetical protein CYMTET_47946 [Cymbomonas tetramitiformis]|uniref:EamA domain-containing protein n=1 Tax=Cymbomonas tetramitiformis TaxID=36881 RepID=A0AAE0BUA7_9CHLO|nr:hypothetical protein CYMTET_47946 [Cymbomonas tetramitiformis]
MWDHCRTVFKTVQGSRKALGYFYVVSVAVIWVAASYLVKEIVHSGISPFILTYICNSLFVLYLPLVELQHLSPQKHCRQTDDCTPPEEDLGFLNDAAHGELAAPAVKKEEPYTRWQTARAALIICPFWFSAQLTFNASLKRSSVTSNTILSSLSSLFTFFLSVRLLRERFTFVKLGGVASYVVGTALVALKDAEKQEGGSADSLGGDALCLLSAAIYALYTVGIRKVLPDEERVNAAQFFGFIGLFNLIILAPVVMYLHFTGEVDITHLPAQPLAWVVVKGLFDNVLSDYLWVRAVLLVGPTITSVGMGIQVPLAIFVDIVLGKAPWILSLGPAALMLGGATLILLGFGTVAYNTDQGEGNQSSEAHQGEAHAYTSW